jgi:lipoate-protein ligase A
MKSHWRLLMTPAAAGSWNMAVDEAVLESCANGASAPTLRLYAWHPACLSLGFSQPVADVDQVILMRQSWDLVRRPTGGRAILHTDELTYSIIAPSSTSLVAGSVLQSYSRIAQALLAVLTHLSLSPRADCEYEHPPETEPRGPVCFEVPSNYEITVEGKKLIGSAQARRMGGVLQHGTLPICGDLTRITRVLVYHTETLRQEAAQRLLEHATTLESLLNRPVTWEQAAQAFITAFEDQYGLRFITGELSADETQRAVELVQKKYNNHAWTLRV